MEAKGKAWKFGDNINTDDIIAARYLNTTDEKQLAAHCMETIRPEFSKKIQKGDIIVAGENFGCGSSREHAPVSIKGCGISAVIAKSFARIFLRNSINIGLPVIELQEADEIEEGDELEILGILLGNYENENFPIDLPDPIEAIKFRMEQLNYSQSDLAEVIGLKSRASEILNRKRKLTLDMIRKITEKLHIPTEVLIQAY